MYACGRNVSDGALFGDEARGWSCSASGTRTSQCTTALHGGPTNDVVEKPLDDDVCCVLSLLWIQGRVFLFKCLSILSGFNESY